jgi:hypothetical protein
MDRYRITLTIEQITIIQQALEIYARLGTGQIDMALDQLPLDGDNKFIFPHIAAAEIHKIISHHTKDHVDGWRSSLGIASDKVSTWSQVAWEMYTAMRHKTSWDQAIKDGLTDSYGNRNWSKMLGVCYDDPHHITDHEPITVEAVINNKE